MKNAKSTRGAKSMKKNDKTEESGRNWRKKSYDRGYKNGVTAAAGVLDGGGFNATTTHEFLLGDVVLCKLNQTRREKPRRNKQAMPKSSTYVTQGFALALAEMARATGNDGATQEVASAAGLTLTEAKKAGVDSYDLKALRKAGVPS